MLPELGHFALILALLLAGLQAFFGIVGPMVGRDRWVAAVTPAVAGQFVMIGTAMACLIYSFVANDFSVTLHRRELEFRVAAVLSRDRALGRARRLAAVVDFPPELLDGGCFNRCDAHAAALRRRECSACWES